MSKAKSLGLEFCRMLTQILHLCLAYLSSIPNLDHCDESFESLNRGLYQEISNRLITFESLIIILADDIRDYPITECRKCCGVIQQLFSPSKVKILRHFCPRILQYSAGMICEFIYLLDKQAKIQKNKRSQNRYESERKKLSNFLWQYINDPISEVGEQAALIIQWVTFDKSKKLQTIKRLFASKKLHPKVRGQLIDSIIGSNVLDLKDKTLEKLDALTR